MCQMYPLSDGGTQSSTEEHCLMHSRPPHLYGVQSVVCPPGLVTVWSPSHVEADTHSPVAVLQSLPLEQSAFVAHVSRHPAESHTYGAQDRVCASPHRPSPSHTAAKTAMPSEQAA